MEQGPHKSQGRGASPLGSTIYALVAQSVERHVEGVCVISSSLIRGTIWKGGRVWVIATVLKTADPQGSVGSNPTPSSI